MYGLSSGTTGETNLPKILHIRVDKDIAYSTIGINRQITI